MAETLRELRRRRGLSLEALGYMAEIDAATVSRMERGLTKPHRITVVALARALGVSVGQMLKLLGQDA